MGHLDADQWGRYNAAQAGRGVRMLARLAAEEAGPGEGRSAVELGCGAGREAVFLADQGWSVQTFDADPTVVDSIAEIATDRAIKHTLARLEDLRELPPCDLVLACVSLPFVPRAHFPALWVAVLRALRPGGVLAVDLFGDRDDWAAGDGTFLTRDEVDELVTGLEVLRLDEEERDGPAFSGPKHWHTYQLVARRP
ncbi:methyltransferase domain-containing protein [Kocuria rhizophila]|uniref:methyltransferase domain-containing protein n=1 Tax=Kocuria rhizophila TaxID=72000 RepID=UPI003D6DBA35